MEFHHVCPNCGGEVNIYVGFADTRTLQDPHVFVGCDICNMRTREIVVKGACEEVCDKAMTAAVKDWNSGNVVRDPNWPRRRKDIEEKTRKALLNNAQTL